MESFIHHIRNEKQRYMPKQSIKGELSTLEKITSYLPFLHYLVISLLNYRRTYRNYISIIIHILRREYPVESILRNSEHITLHNHTEAFFFTVINGHKGVQYDIPNDIVSLSSLPCINKNEVKIKIYGGINNGDISIFLRNEYILPIKGKTVIDVGANIGDSPILFALCGAERVIGIEPFPKNYEIAKKNIEVNGLSNRITMVLAACASDSGYITIDPDYESNIKSRLIGFKEGMSIPLMTLENILSENNVQPGEAVLKIDCEGCEYDIIMSSSKDTLRKFSDIQIEYHHGYKNLKEKLEKSGFNVLASRPMLHYTAPKSYVGRLYAKQN